MATSKKTHTTKKATVTKKTPARKVASKAKARPLTWRFYAVTIGIFIVAVTTIVVIALLTSSTVAKNTNQARLDRVNGIYNSLSLGDGYVTQSKNIFGEKRVYDWDKTRTQASEVKYVHGDTVSNTVADLDAKIKAAGFTFVSDPQPDAKNVQYHYKSSKGEYLRLTVVSKPYQDAAMNASVMNDNKVPEEVHAMDSNAGPTSVTIKVNLDGNND